MNLQKRPSAGPSRQVRFQEQYEIAMNELHRNRQVRSVRGAWMPGVTRKRVRALARKMARVRMVEPTLSLAR